MDKSDIVLLCIVTFCSFALGILIGYTLELDSVSAGAVSNGAAHWGFSDSGNTVLIWNTNAPAITK